MNSIMQFCCCMLLTVSAMATPVQDQKSPELDVRTPKFDQNGRFYVYKNFKKDETELPFIPYGWMPEKATTMLGENGVNLECSTDPYRDASTPAAKPAEGEAETCIAVTVQKWVFPNWCGVAFISGPPGTYKTLPDGTKQVDPNDPPWWGEKNRGWYYDLRGLKKKKLVFYARGETGQERIQVKVGILGDKPFGGRPRFPAETDVLTLPKTWTRFELDLSDLQPEDLRLVCNGFTIIMSKDQQTGSGKEGIKFYLDNIFFE